MQTVKVYLEIEVDVQAEYHPAVPAKTYGEPEDCYPEEPEEINFYLSPKTQFEAWDILQNAVNSEKESIEDQIRDHFIAEKERTASEEAQWLHEEKRWAANG